MKLRQRQLSESTILGESTTTLVRNEGVEIKECITFDRDNLQKMLMIVAVVKEIGNTDVTHFSLTSKNSQPSIQMDKAGDRLMGLLLTISSEFPAAFPIHKFHPSVMLLLQLIKELPVNDRLFRPGAFKYPGEFSVDVTCLNQLVDEIRKKARSAGHKKAVCRFRHSTLKNQRSLRVYINALIQCYPRLFVLRVDLGYQHDVSGIQTMSNQPQDFAAVKEHRLAFFKFLKKQYPGALVGFVWKLEYGRCKGFQHHIILFFDGSMVHEGHTVGHTLGHFWQFSLNNGAGLFCNANQSGFRSRCCGTGLVMRNDHAKHLGLAAAISYVTQPDMYVQVAFPEKARGFGRGNVPTKNAARREISRGPLGT